MPLTSHVSKPPKEALLLPVLGVAGMSLSLLGGASASTAPTAPDTASRAIASAHEITLHEEEINDVSLATFYVFDKESAATEHGTQLARGCGCGGCRGGGGGCRAGGGCGGRGCGGCRGCGGRGCGGCGGCGGGCVCAPFITPWWCY